MNRPIIHLKNINKTYHLSKSRLLTVLKNINLTVEKGDFLAIMGPSGSGKSTLMNIIGFLDWPSSGNYEIDSQDTQKIQRSEFYKLRNKKVGFVFQNYNLLPRYSIYKNVELPLIYSRQNRNLRKNKVMKAIEDVGLTERSSHRPNQLSGGEAQRAAIARALVNEPEILLADEPTGNVDTKTGDEIMKLLKEANEKGTTVLVVTHDPHIASWAKKTIHLVDGELIPKEL